MLTSKEAHQPTFAQGGNWKNAKHITRWRSRLGEMALLSRVEHTNTDQDLVELRAVLDRIAADKEREAQLWSPRAATPRGRKAVRTYGEFVCVAEGSASKGKSEVLMLTRDSDFDVITGQLKKAFNLAGNAQITVPEDRLSEEMEQLVLSTRHLHSFLDDFVQRQSTRRTLKVARATLPITRCLVGRSCSHEEGEEGIILALNQLLELAQIPGNLDTMDRLGYLSELLMAVASVVEHSTSPASVAAACRVVWKLAHSGGLRCRMLDFGLLASLWKILGYIGQTVETPECRKAREAATRSATDTSTNHATGGRGSIHQESPAGGATHLGESREPMELVAGAELDELTINCLGALSMMLRSEKAKGTLAGPVNSQGLKVLLDLSTVGQGSKSSIEDERVPCMAAEALAFVLITHGGCRMAWAQCGRFLSLLDALSSPHPRVILCGVSICNAFLRGKPWQIIVSPMEAGKALRAASVACQRCLDSLQLKLCLAKANNTAQRSVGSGTHLALHTSMDADTRESLRILEQATAVCWGSLAIIDRCPPAPEKTYVPLACWLPTMLAVAKLAGTTWVPRWVTFCAVASIGLGISVGSQTGADDIPEIGNLPAEMLALLKKTNPSELQERAARALCTMLGANASLRRQAVKDGFLDKLQRLLMGRLGSARLDSIVACTIMLLCDVDNHAIRSHTSEAKPDTPTSPGGGHDDTCTILSRPKRPKKRGGTEWTKKQLTSLVWALGHSNQDVLTYTAWTMWLLARHPETRASLGRLWAIDGLVNALRSNARLPVKEGLLAATWLLARDLANTVRLAMNGALQVLVGMLNFPCDRCYVPLKTLAVGTMCTLCQIEPDVAALSMQLSLAPALLKAVHSDISSAYLKVLSAGLVFTMCRNAEHRENRAEYMGQFIDEGGHFVLEEMCASLLRSTTPELQACGAFFASSLSLAARSRQRLLHNGSLEALCHLVRMASTKEPLRLRSLHALLNLSTEADCQAAICRLALPALVELTVSAAPPSSPSCFQSEFASSILFNSADNPSCRSIMFQAQLARGSEEIVDARAAGRLEKPPGASPWAHNVSDGSVSPSGIVRKRYLTWVEEIKGGAIAREIRSANELASPSASPEDCRTPAREVNCGTRSTTVDPADGEPGPATRGGGSRHAGAIDMKLQAVNEQSSLVRVRHNIRQPVTSLWQTEAERARTAPARSTDLSLRRPKSHIGAAKDGEFGSPAMSVGPGETWGKGVSSAGSGCAAIGSDGDNTRDGRAPALRERVSAGSPDPMCRSGAVGKDGPSRERATPMPLRSSHRVGPVGALGSTPLPAGEYRWKPFVSDCYTKPNVLPAWRRQQTYTPNTGKLAKGLDGARRSISASGGPLKTSLAPLHSEPTQEERDAMFSQAVKENQTVVVVEPPLNYKMVFDGPTHVGPAKSIQSPASMALFPHARGASVCAPLFEHYVAEDGMCYHMYHTSSVICEVLDPGGYPPLSEPNELRHVLQRSLPEQPSKDYPSGKPDAKPVLYLPPSRQCPPITTHYVTLCKVKCRQAHGNESCPGEVCNMFGAMPSDFMVFEVGEGTPVEKDDDEPANTPTLDSTKWDINRSIFAPRRKEAESRSFWDTDRVVRKALDADYSRMLKEDRVLKLMAKSDAAVAKGQKPVKESLEELKKAIAPFYKKFLSIFKYFCLTPSQSVRGAFSIQPNQFGKMMQDAGLAGNYISVEEIGKIFVLVNFESDKRSAEADVNEDRALMRFELIEALLRVAITVRDNQGQEEVSPADKLRTIIEEQLLVNLPPEAMEDPDTFRNEALYTEACDNVLQDHQKALAVVYQKYSLLDPVAGKPFFGLEEWKTFTNDARLVGDNVHMLRMGLREMKQPFYLARMMVSDEIKSRNKMTQLTFVDFLEALARLSVVIPLPSDEDLQEAQVTEILDYEMALSAGYENSPVYQASVAAATGGELAPRLDRLIRFIVGTLAIRSNGVVKARNKGVNLVGLYCTKEHLIRGILP